MFLKAGPTKEKGFFSRIKDQKKTAFALQKTGDFVFDNDLESEYKFIIKNIQAYKENPDNTSFFEKHSMGNLLEFVRDAKMMKKVYQTKLDLTLKFLHGLRVFIKIKVASDIFNTNSDMAKMGLLETRANDSKRLKDLHQLQKPEYFFFPPHKTREEEAPHVFKTREYDIDELTSSVMPLLEQYIPGKTLTTLPDYQNTNQQLIKDMKLISNMGDQIENTVGITITKFEDGHQQSSQPYDVMKFLDKVTKTPKGMKNPGRLYGPKDSLFRREDLVRHKIQVGQQQKAKANSIDPGKNTGKKVIDMIKNLRSAS
jgi:hypothetical protein